MPRNGANVYSKPAGTTAVSGTTIESSKYNQTIDDLVNDANLARPIVAGGTGGTTASDARSNLGLEIGSDIQGYSATLESIGALGGGSQRIAYTTGVNTWAETNLTVFAQDLLGRSTAGGWRGELDASQSPLDEDDFASNSAAQPPTQQSAKAYVDNTVSALPFTKQYKSSNQTVVSGATRILAHGLSETPKLVQLRLRFVSAVHGYSIGDEVLIAGDLTQGDANRGVSVRAQPANLYITYGTDSDVFRILDTSGARTNVSNSDVRLIAYAWA